MAGIPCGLDFGTSNSVISLAGTGTDESCMEPSLIHFPPSREGALERHVGQEAVDRYLESGMAGRFFQSVKTLLPDPDFLHTRVNGKPMKPEDLVAVVLRHLRTVMEERIRSPLDSVVLGRPARFSTLPERDRLAQDRLEKAARQAGFTNVAFELEPIAAAWAYERTLEKEELVLVGDFGGGTSDFTVVRLSPDRAGQGDRTGDILGSGGVYLGGDTFDRRIMEEWVIPHFGSGSTWESFGQQLPVPVHLYTTLCRWEQIHFLKTGKAREEIREMIRSCREPAGLRRFLLLVEKDYAWGLVNAVRKAKHKLSDQDDAAVFYKVPEFLIAQGIPRRGFEDGIGGDVDAIRDCVQEVLASAGTTPDRIQSVFLTGGSSRVPAVQAAFAGLFGPDRIRQDQRQFLSIARGLALKAESLWA